jgi:mannose-6-phosphate isomerase-like protein (cupin superfamily)
MTTYRRVVTGHNEEGKAIIAIDGEAGHRSGNLYEMWNTTSMPADNTDPTDVAATREMDLEPDPNGTVFRFFEVKPERELASPEDRERAAQVRLATMNEKQRAAAISRKPDTTRHPGMHQTKTVDYIILLKGEVTMLVDEGEVDLKPFDVVVQRGTNHAWVNKGKESAALVAVMVEAEPLT